MSVLERASSLLFAGGTLVASRLAILTISFTLSMIGILFVHSTTAHELESFPSYEAGMQILKLLVGIALLVAILFVHYRVLERLAYVLYAGLLVVLGVLLVLKYAGGAWMVRWLKIGFLSVQPSEVMKVIIVLALARYLRFRKDQIRLSGLFRPLLLTLIPMIFVVLQPDLGTSLMLPPVLMALLFVANARRTHLATAIMAGALLFPAILAVHFYFPQVRKKFIEDYQMNRIVGYVHRDEQSWKDINYQLGQSLIAFGSGGLTGKGYHDGTQNLGKYVPAKHTDFIFSVIGEELGFLGASLVVLLYLGLVLTMLHVAIRTREPFPRLVVTGIATVFACQGLENFGMTLGLTPITGIPLPFVSFGGSSLVTSYLAVAIVLGIAARNVPVVASPDLNPIDEDRVVPVIDDQPGGANPFPSGH